MSERWRVGRKVGRTIYRQRGQEPSDGDQLLGLMDTPELAEFVVSTVNALAEVMEKLTAEDEA